MRSTQAEFSHIGGSGRSMECVGMAKAPESTEPH